MQSNKYYAKKHRLGAQISPSPLTKYLDRSIKVENLNKTLDGSPPNHCTPRRYGIKAKIYDFKEVNKFFRPNNAYNNNNASSNNLNNSPGSQISSDAQFDKLMLAHEKSFAVNNTLSNAQQMASTAAPSGQAANNVVLDQNGVTILQTQNSQKRLNRSTKQSPPKTAAIFGSPKFRRRLQQKHRLFM